ncbi:kinase-like domain-containing protein [Pisolithus marmoratus]|nr:kinase-like domain-containing protein [Pisolithus marmoratus]
MLFSGNPEHVENSLEKILQTLGRGEEENWDLEQEDGADLQQSESDRGEAEDDFEEVLCISGLYLNFGLGSIGSRYYVIQHLSYITLQLSTFHSSKIKLDLRVMLMKSTLTLKPHVLGTLMDDSGSLKRFMEAPTVLAGSKGIPHVWWFSTDWGTEVLVMDHLGLSLQDIMSRNCSSMFTIETVAEIACQVICILELIHSQDFIHHNIKPSHLLFDFGTLAQEGTIRFLPWQECGLTMEEVIQAKVDIVFQSSLRDKVPMAFFTFLKYAHLLAFDL